MIGAIRVFAVRLRVLAQRVLGRLGFREDSYLLILAVLIGIVTANAAVGFHELIHWIRNAAYLGIGENVLYGRGVVLLILLPALGGLAVGIIMRYVVRGRSAGVIDVMESVSRTSGTIKPLTALEKIVTAGITIGSGGSAGAEGPIVQIGAAIASGIGQLFGAARQHMPLLIGCGVAAGISAIFNSPVGGVLFALEVILHDFSIRSIIPIVLSSVIANVTTHEIFFQIALWEGMNEAAAQNARRAIFALPSWEIDWESAVKWAQIPQYAVLGVWCGILGVSLTRLMYFAEDRFAKLKLRRELKPALGGALMGVSGVAYVMIFGWWLLDTAKPFDFEQYPLPAFYSDGYGVIRQLLDHFFYSATDFRFGYFVVLLLTLIVLKLMGTCLTLGSGGSGGIIAPSLFLGAAGGAVLGLVLERLGMDAGIRLNVFALVGMGAVLAAVVHAPLTAVLILMDLTNTKMMVPAMLASIIATGLARLIFRDSIYTLSLRLRGVHVGTASDLSLLRRMAVEQVDLTPAAIVHESDPFQKVLDLTASTGATDFIVVDDRGNYIGMVAAEDIKTVLLEREAVPLLCVNELMRNDVPTVRSTDDLATVLDAFNRYDVSQIPVAIADSPARVIGLISRAALMRRYQQGLVES